MSEAASVSEAIPRPPKLGRIGWSDVGTALGGGLGDLGRAPVYGLVFGLALAAAGVLAIVSVTWLDAGWLAVCIGVVFPLVFPFLTAGLYEVSRRLDAGEPISWGVVWAAIWRQRERQMGWMAFVVLFIFWIWIYQVRIVLALFMGTGASSDLQRFLTHVVTTSGGLTFLAVGSVVGLILALILFTSTVIAMPLLFDRDLDFVTALIVSWQTVLANKPAMVGLGVLLTAATVAAALPGFLGLILIVPLFGFATWRLYARAKVAE
jgi:uncharacterized membrane protein